MSFNSRSPVSSPPSTPGAPSASSWSWYLRPALPAVETDRLSPAVPWLNGAAWVSGGGPSGRASPFLLTASTESPPVWVALAPFQASSGLDRPGSHLSLSLGMAKEKVNKGRLCLSHNELCPQPFPPCIVPIVPGYILLVPPWSYPLNKLPPKGGEAPDHHPTEDVSLEPDKRCLLENISLFPNHTSSVTP